jgi:hypothetical protein
MLMEAKRRILQMSYRDSVTEKLIKDSEKRILGAIARLEEQIDELAWMIEEVSIIAIIAPHIAGRTVDEVCEIAGKDAVGIAKDWATVFAAWRKSVLEEKMSQNKAKIEEGAIEPR